MPIERPVTWRMRAVILLLLIETAGLELARRLGRELPIPFDGVTARALPEVPAVQADTS